MNIGQRLKDLRARAAVSNPQLAKTSGVSSSVISDIETNKSTPNVTTLHKLCEALDITLADFFAWANHEEGPAKYGLSLVTATHKDSKQAPVGDFDVGARLKELRLGVGVSSSELAKASGVASLMIKDIETGQSVPNLTVIDKVCRALGITLSEFFEPTKEGQMEPPGMIAETHTRMYDSIMRAKELPEDNVDQIADALDALIEFHRRKTKKLE